MTDTSKYWALVNLRYPDGDAEYAKAMKGEEYKEVVVTAGDLLVRVPEKSIKALLSMGREVITTEAPPAPEPAPRGRSVSRLADVKMVDSDGEDKVVKA